MNRKLKLICAVIALTVAVVCFASCKENAHADKLREINSAMLNDYSQVTLNVKTHSDLVDLNAKYVMTKSGNVTNVTYETEQLNAIDQTSGPSEFVSTLKGTAVFDGSKIVSINGDQVNEDVLLDVADRSMTFRLSFFDGMKSSQNEFSANVKNPQGFLQNDDFKGTDVKINVKLDGSDVKQIVLTYVLDGAEITLDYAFVR